MKEKERKLLLLRLDEALWVELARWADDDFRSINGQIEYLLTEAVRSKRKKSLPSEEGSQDE
ncbi:MAG: Arc family DNA-binding protein [Sphaerochaeta sp.]